MRNRFPERFESFLVSVLMSKKGMPRPTKDDCRKAEKATFEALTNPRMSDPREFSEDELFMRREITRTVWDIFRRTKFSFSGDVEPFYPSTSANYINSRAAGGAVGSILSHPSLLQGLKTSSRLVNLIKKDDETFVDTSKLRSSFQSLYRRMLAMSYDEKPIAVPLGLPESLKIRVITKGPPLRQTVLKPLQVFMWSKLRRLKVFELIGSPVTETILSDRFPFRSTPFLSVDYSDATNEMFSWCSEAVAMALQDIWGLPDHDHWLMMEALTRHDIEFEGIVRPQTRGQLMGSILSFPVLCIVNLALCRSALEHDIGGRISVSEVPLLINGDDALMQIGERGRAFWAKYGPVMGLVPSLGKVYYDMTFFNINSTTFTVYDVGSVLGFTRVPWINMGLMSGLKRSSTIQETSYMSLGQKVTKLVLDSPEELRERVLSQYLFKHRKVLRSMGVPWFLPEHLLGLGFPSVGQFCPGRLDLLFCKEAQKYRRPALPRSAWRSWEYASNSFNARELLDDLKKNLDLSSAERIDEELSLNDHWFSVDRIKSAFAIEALFRVSGIDDLYEPDARQSVYQSEMAYYRRLRKTWKHIYALGEKASFSDPSLLLPPLKLNSFPLFRPSCEMSLITCPLGVPDTDDVFFTPVDDRIDRFNWRDGEFTNREAESLL